MNKYSCHLATILLLGFITAGCSEQETAATTDTATTAAKAAATTVAAATDTDTAPAMGMGDAAAMGMGMAGGMGMGAAQPAGPSSPADAPSGTYQAESGHRYISFSYVHGGYSKPVLRWRDWDSTLEWNGDDPSASSVSVTIDANSIDSGVDVFDGHLRGERHFDVANNPTITFNSTSASLGADNTGQVTGDLTIKGTTLPVTLDVTFNKTGVDGRSGNQVIGFSGTTTVKRSDWGLSAAVPTVGDEVNIIIETEYRMELP